MKLEEEEKSNITPVGSQLPPEVIEKEDKTIVSNADDITQTSANSEKKVSVISKLL